MVFSIETFQSLGKASGISGDRVRGSGLRKGVKSLKSIHLNLVNMLLPLLHVFLFLLLLKKS